MTSAILALTIATLAVSLFGRNDERQVAKSLKTTYSVPVEIEYLIALPKGYEDDPERRWPLLLFLHGAGESGRDLEKVKTHGPPKLIGQGRELPFIVVSPQCPSVAAWWPVDPLKALLDRVEQDYRVDLSREYVTGLSMGGYGTWALACDQPGRFAAIAPVCGGGIPRIATRLKDVPVWVFHGAKDTIVPLSESQEMVDALRAVRGDVKFTVLPEAGHDSWTAAYEGQELYDWLLGHKKK